MKMHNSYYFYVRLSRQSMIIRLLRISVATAENDLGQAPMGLISAVISMFLGDGTRYRV